MASTKNLWSIDDCLAEYNKDPTNIQFVDATWFRMGPRDARQEFEDGPRLPGAFHFGTSDLTTSHSLFPELNPKKLNLMFPQAWLIGMCLDEMGIDPSNPPTLVVYGKKGTMFAPRAWSILKRFYTLAPVKILHGSLEDWVAKGGPVDTEPAKSIKAKDLVEKANDQAGKQHPLISSTATDSVVDMAFVLKTLENQEANPTIFLDCRGPSEFAAGHIPGAGNVPFPFLSNSDNRLHMKSKDELESIVKKAVGEETFEKLKEGPTVVSCNSCITACTLDLVLDDLGCANVNVYDGSWNEWGQEESTPKETC